MGGKGSMGQAPDPQQMSYSGGGSAGGGKAPNPYAGGNKNVGYWNPGGGKVPSYEKGGSQNDKAPRTYSAGGTLVGGSLAAYLEGRKQRRLAENAVHLAAGKKAVKGRAAMKGVPAGHTYPSFSTFGPQDLLRGSDNNTGSLLGGSEEDDR